MINFSFNGNTISAENKLWTVKYPIEDARIINNKIVVLYNPSAQVEKFRQFRNLAAFDLNGQLL